MTPLRILAIALLTLILVPSGAHVFELPHKIALDRDNCRVVQGIYAGWSPSGWSLKETLGLPGAHVAVGIP